MRADGGVELWLADVGGTAGWEWPVPRLARFAYELGVAQAAALMPEIADRAPGDRPGHAHRRVGGGWITAISSNLLITKCDTSPDLPESNALMRTCCPFISIGLLRSD